MLTEGANFHPAVSAWFDQSFPEPTPIQQAAWPAIASGEHTLIAAPTGSGKTLAAFLWAINALVLESERQGLTDRTRILYVSPLKALSNDVDNNLKGPLEGIAAQCQWPPEIRSAVRTGDTPQSERSKMRKKPPHILVTTPESLFLLLTSESGRDMLGGIQTVIVDEVHALAGSKRGAHLALSLARLSALLGHMPQHVGLSATQKPIENMARFLVGQQPCRIVDVGHRRDMDLKLEVPGAPLTAIMANEVWEEVYQRLTELVEQHRTTLVFVNTRRLAERAAKHLAERLGEEAVTSHHGSLAREHRLKAEQRLKAGELKVLVATASLELGIDIGDVDLVCQLGSPGGISVMLQRVGRSGHAVGARPKGRLFPLALDELVESVAIIDAVSRGELDSIVPPEAPLDVLSQHVVAEVASRDCSTDELYQLVRSAWAYHQLSRKQFDQVISMVADGFTTRRGRRGAYLHYDQVNGRLKARRGARLTALTNAGTIPDHFDYDVVLAPGGLKVGTLNEDFAFESMPGDIFQLGNQSYRILKVETGRVFVDDAHGLPPTIPFWFGEAPGRSDELSRSVSELRQRIDEQLGDGEVPEQSPWPEVPHEAWQQLVSYLKGARKALKGLPTQQRIVMERFFDETGDMHLVIHSPYGSRINRAWGLSLRKRFCRKFNFELQAAALEDSIVLSLGATHSFPLEEVPRYLKSTTVRDVLIQATLDSPMFEARWRWCATTALAVRRNMAGKKVPPQFQRNDAEDLVAVVFPDQLACLENIQGAREVPDHPLIKQTLSDCLHEVMDIEGLESLLVQLERGEVEMVGCDLPAPSPLSEAIINARPFAFLDDGDAEARRTMAIRQRPELWAEDAVSIGEALPDALVQEVLSEIRYAPRDAEELHDLLVTHGFVLSSELKDMGVADALFERLARDRRAARVAIEAGEVCVAAERAAEFAHAFGIDSWPKNFSPVVSQVAADDAITELLRSRLEMSGPVAETELRRLFAHEGRAGSVLTQALLALEGEGFIVRGPFIAGAGECWCERRLLARIHRARVQRKRRFQPVPAAAFMRFLFDWHGLAGDPMRGLASLKVVLSRLEACPIAAAAWESAVLPARLADYGADMLDQLTGSGEWTWMRLAPDAKGGAGRSSLKQTRVALFTRAALKPAISMIRGCQIDAAPSGVAVRVHEVLSEYGALFFDELLSDTGLLESQLEDGLAELVGLGLVNADQFQGLRSLMANADEQRKQARYRRRGHAVRDARSGGRWSLLRLRGELTDRWTEPQLMWLAGVLLRRYGVVFRRVIDNESGLPPWRDLLYVLRRLEARGEVLGGRFVDGFAGEQFALTEVATRLKQIANRDGNDLVVLSAADPLNLTGIITPGERIAAHTGHRIAFRHGQPVAVWAQGEARSLTGEEVDWALHDRLRTAPTVGGNRVH